MKRNTRLPRGSLVWLLAVACALSMGSSGRTGTDRLDSAVTDWRHFVETHPDTGEDWKQTRQICQPLLDQALAELAKQRRELALIRIAAAWPYLSAAKTVDRWTASGALDSARFVTESRRMARELAPLLANPHADAFASVRPALVRATGETALLQVRGYDEGGRGFASNSQPDAGLFYLAMARGAGDLSQWVRTLDERVTGPEPRFRSLAPELDAFERELEAAYRPPASVSHHGDFIATHSALNDARSLDRAGLVRGALLRYLQARSRFAPVRGDDSTDTAETAQRLAAIERRLADGRDHSIATLFMQRAAEGLEDTAKAGRMSARVVVNDIVPAYLAAIGPPPARPAPRTPEATVTLVRWPYT